MGLNKSDQRGMGEIQERRVVVVMVAMDTEHILLNIEAKVDAQIVLINKFSCWSSGKGPHVSDGWFNSSDVFRGSVTVKDGFNFSVLFVRVLPSDNL